MSMPTLSINPRLRSTPFTPRVEAAGVKAYTVYNHMLLPTVFRSMEEDYRHLKEHVQLWDVSVERQVEVCGKDAVRLVQLMTPRDLSKAVPGRCFYVPLVDENGGTGIPSGPPVISTSWLMAIDTMMPTPRVPMAR